MPQGDSFSQILQGFKNVTCTGHVIGLQMCSWLPKYPEYVGVPFTHSFQTLSFPNTDLEADGAERTLHVLKELLKTTVLTMAAADLGGEC